MTKSDYLMDSLFHQDFDLVGHTVSEIMSAFLAVTPRAEQGILRVEIAGFLSKHSGDVDEAFETTFRPDVIRSAFCGSTRAFLEELRDRLE